MSFLLTAELADKAINLVLPAIDAAYTHQVINRLHLHIVVLNPTSIALEGAILVERSIGDTNVWAHPYDRIARSKAMVTWRTGLPSHEVLALAPHLYVEGDVRYGGSTNLNGIVVACSGVQSHFDQMIAQWIASACYALCIDEFEPLTGSTAPDFLGE